MMTRRLPLLALCFCLLAGPAFGRQAPPAAPAPAPSFEERLAARAAENRYAVAFADGKFSGPGWERLLERGRQAPFFLVGEEHGIAEVPALVRELFRALVPAGYRHLAIEISPPMARALDETARGADGLAKISRLFQDYPPGVPFYTLAEEADLLVAARAAVPGSEPVLWGLDYEVMADRYLLDRVRRRAPDGAARAAAEALFAKSETAWKTVSETKNPGAFFSFSQKPEVLAELRTAWPAPDAESAEVLHVIEETLAINQSFVGGRNWESNARRAELNRRSFLKAWREVRAKQPAPRVMLKFGASHMLRGRNMTEVFDVGTLAAELAALEGAPAYHLLVVGGAGTQQASFNPQTLQYMATPVSLSAGKALQPLVQQAFPQGFTLLDLTALRPLLSSARTQTADPELMRLVHGFDGLLILTGSHPAKGLP